jgi:hypothetical protein
MSKLVLVSCAVLALIAASGAARAAVLYDDTPGAAVAPGWTPGYESASYSGSSPAQEFTATGTGKVTSFSFEFSNPSDHTDPLVVSLWTTNAANVAFGSEIGSWAFTSEIGANPFTQTVDVTGGALLTSGVRYGIELSTSSTATSTDWLTNSNVTVENYSVCNVAFYCTDPNGLTPTDNSTYFTGNSASGPQLLFAINGAAASAAPEPAAWVMLLAGLGGLGVALRMARRPGGALLVNR